MRKKLTFLLFLLVAGITTAMAQNITVKGKVVDQNSQPLPGVSVTVKGTQTGTLTDVGGNYTLNAPSNATLVLSYIGYDTQELAVSGRSSINVTMTEGVKSLNEVVVVGYGTQKKSVVTGSISRVKASDLENQQVTRFDQALQGRTSGVTVVAGSGAPNAAPIIRVRGITSINNTDPLYVIDGVVSLNGGLENLNPNDIESIEVLKDASAAIYGSRSSNGVVLVTTKKGKSGAPTLSYNGYYGTQKATKQFDVVNATQYATLRNQAVTNDGGTAPFANPGQYGTGTNWQDVIFGESAAIQNHNLMVQGGTDASKYYVSFGYLNQQGIVLSDISNFKKYNFTANTSFQPKKWLSVGQNFAYTYTRNQSNFSTNNEFGGPLSSSLNLDPITPILAAQEDLNGTPYTDKPVVKDAQGRPYAISKYVGQEMSNPLAYLETQRGNYGWSHNLLGNAFVEIQPIKGLRLKTQINGKQAFWGSQSYTPLYYLTTQNNNTTNRSASRGSNRNLTWNWDNTISYNRQISKHDFTVLLGTSAQEQSEVGLSGTYNNLPVDDYRKVSFNYALPNENRIASSYEAQPYRVTSIFGRVNYSFDEKYLFTGIIRRDGSSKFGSNNVYGTFPSAQVGWVATREDFFPKNSFVDFLKVRASYGEVGNELSLSTFQYTSVVAGGSNAVFGPGGLVIGNSPQGPQNPNLKWESTKTTDIGFDAVIFKDFNVTVDVYRKLTSGMLQSFNLPGYAGYNGQFFDNIGDLENKGIELEVGYNGKSGDFKYNVSGNISYNKNEVTFLGSRPYIDGGSFQNSSYPLFRTQSGQPVASFYGFQELGTFKSQAEIDAYTLNGTRIQPNAKPGDFKWADNNGNGVIDEGDRTFLGSQLPKWTYGINLRGNYKNFDMMVFGQGVWGNKLFQGYRRLDIATANYSTAALDAWTPQNAGSNYPRLSDLDPNNNFKNPSNFYLQSGAYFRIKTLQLGYTLPTAVLSKIDVKKARIFISSNNLVTITKYDGFDPEIAGSIDRGIYPQARTFMVGLDFTL
ncbi:TonB-dependent receptor [Mucilaginibacter sp. JRF]|uniref:SusC/RagA family TonB-linked outer membrane protein n=1 Tax=Mucilaginibacter sp. JRF TaxID=2780088 RepID=UPI00187E5628|nr:TonB-dependent receptor [Mucilaginibacter sp. JRF]MBE9585091.1 TonB-dependent receptor [Mucilaginibacter sp. JRF]